MFSMLMHAGDGGPPRGLDVHGAEARHPDGRRARRHDPRRALRRGGSHGRDGSGTGILMVVTIIYGCERAHCVFRACADAYADWEIGMRESGGIDMGSFCDIM